VAARETIRAIAPGAADIPRFLEIGSRLSKDSVANVSQVVSLDRDVLNERVGRVSKKQLELVFAGLDLVMGR
jgi:mRNA-degrading endonuclease toxin of MazEF toxin-antitoxin module